MITNVKVGVGPKIDSPFFCLGIGSCFVGHLENSLAEWGIPYIYNPLGTSFNPISIAHQLRWIFDDQFKLDPYFSHNEYYHALFAGNKFQDTSLENLRNTINKQRLHLFNKGFNRVENSVIIISLGTAHAWEINHTIVNNCHKLPGQLFNRKLLSINEIVKVWQEVIPFIPPNITLIFTVSPVRYTKIGLQENFLGKSILRLAIQELLQLRTNCLYFPSYEIITDELRDYSFFESNGTHPNKTAVDVVMKRFKEFLALK